MALLERAVAAWPDPIGSLDTLLAIIAARLSVCLVFIRTDEDIERIGLEQAAFAPALVKTLSAEFRNGSTEGLLMEHQDPRPGDRRYLAIIDARGGRAIRAYFTAWHELTHLLVSPSQLEFKLFRRAPSAEQIRKDPIESVVDHIAGLAAFYEPIFGPALRRAIQREGRLTFTAVDQARGAVAPEASLYAAAVAAVRLAPGPACLLSAEMRFKPTELRKLTSPQRELGLGATKGSVPKLRVVDVVTNEGAERAGLAFHPHLRVPDRSVLHRVYDADVEGELVADEDQAWWTTSTSGALRALRIRVSAVRRGTRVYGLAIAERA